MNLFLKVLSKVALVVPGAAKRVAGATNGKKTFIGLGTVAVGVGLLFVPGAQHIATDTIYTGITITAGGLTHKAVKKMKSEK